MSAVLHPLFAPGKLLLQTHKLPWAVGSPRLSVLSHLFWTTVCDEDCLRNTRWLCISRGFSYPGAVRIRKVTNWSPTFTWWEGKATRDGFKRNTYVLAKMDGKVPTGRGRWSLDRTGCPMINTVLRCWWVLKKSQHKNSSLEIMK